ncbi:hypothetical protein K0B96_06615 [Horticoccus luteus]|uniref:Uncharacterized protein n=1 Tax=Horticoccus luteus TaxID=2862869 RepID=A0A8F9TZC0_9BACT|nr:hypothetical protein [Horticoccus luteus]QYM80282.1 hypothetical protein K0B96_06615 [Horticoccus luteus]
MKALRTTTGIALASGGFFPLVSLGNEARVVTDDGSDLRPGLVALANETRFNVSHFSESLTQFSTGYRDPENLLAATDYIAPPVQVGRRFDWKNADQSKYFLTEIDDERPIGGGFKKVEFGGAEQTSKTKNRGLMTVIDADESGGVIDEEAITASLLQRIFRNKYRRAITALLAITAGDGAIFAANTQPDEILKAALEAAQLETGVYPNRGLIGLSGWNLRSAAYAAQNTAGATAQLTKSLSQVAGDLFLDELRVDKSVYQQTKTAKGRIVPASFIGFHGRDGLTKDDPSNLKQFWTPVVGGGRYRVYRRVYGPADKFIEITIEHYENILGTSSIGATRKNITNA